MKEIMLKIEDNVYSEIKSSMTAKGICGSLYGIADGVIVKLIESIDNKETELILKFKKK